MHKKIYIIFIGLLLFSSFTYLAWLEKNKHDYNLNKNWWALYFENPKDSSLSFVVENHSSSSSFHSEILLEKNKISENDFILQKNEQKLFPVNATDLKNKKITITITSGEQKKEIYKIIN